MIAAANILANQIYERTVSDEEDQSAVAFTL